MSSIEKKDAEKGRQGDISKLMTECRSQNAEGRFKNKDRGMGRQKSFGMQDGNLNIMNIEVRCGLKAP